MKGIVAVALVALFLTPAAHAAVTVIYSNFGSGNAYNHLAGWMVNGSHSAAMPFTPSADCTLNTITVGIGWQGGTNSLTLAVYKDTAGLPGTALESWTGITMGLYSAGGTETVTDTQDLQLEGGTQYWVVASGGGGDTTATWGYNPIGDSGGSAVNAGSGWGASIGSRGAFSVTLRPATVYNNFDTGGAYYANGCVVAGSLVGGGTPTDWAMPFTPTANCTLSTIAVGIGLASGTNSLGLAVCSDSGGVPGAALESWTGISMGAKVAGTTTTVAETVTDTTNVTLLAGTQYWIVAIAGAADTDAVWGNNSTGDNGAVAYKHGATWTPFSTFRGAFSVTGVTLLVPDLVNITAGPTADVNPAQSGGPVHCGVTATDGWGHGLTYAWTAKDSTSKAGGSFDDATKANPVWTAAPNLTGAAVDYTIQVTVTCSQGKTATGSVVEHVNPLGDIVSNGHVTTADVAAFMDAWRLHLAGSTAWNSRADLDNNGILDARDVELMVEAVLRNM